MAKAKVVRELIDMVTGTSKPTPKPGRKRKARGSKPATPDQKLGAKKAGVNISNFKKLPDAEQKKFIKEAKDAGKPKKKKKSVVKRSSKDNKELRGLMAQQKREMKDDEGFNEILPRRRATGTKGQEVEQGPLLSKVPVPKKRESTKETRKRLKRTGMLREGEYAPPASMISEEMGLTGRGSEMLPTGKELDDLISSGFEIKKAGGMVKRRMGGMVTKGYGAAKRGY
tara:strand:- start:59 stop:739 length:681 start_codon:yes stop_codon:yes gene_type:complete